MGTGIMSVVKTTTPKFEKYFTKKGTLRKKMGKPPIDLAIEFTIYAKVLQISKGRKLSHWKAWLQLTQHRNFHTSRSKRDTPKKDLKIKQETLIGY